MNSSSSYTYVRGFEFSAGVLVNGEMGLNNTYAVRVEIYA